jgi:cell division protein FtsQ
VWWIPLELALVAVVTWGLSTGVQLLANPMTLPVKTVRVVGDLHHVNSMDLEQALASVATGGFLGVNVHEVRKAAVALPWVEDAQVRRVWPDTLRITVVEQVPVARWTAGGLINGHGEVFTPDPSTYPADLPELGGPQGSAAGMLGHLHRLDRVVAPLNLTVTALHVDERRAWTITLSNGIQLLLGKNDLDNRLARFLRVYPSALAAQADYIKHIDLRYSNGFAVGWKHAA